MCCVTLMMMAGCAMVQCVCGCGSLSVRISWLSIVVGGSLN